LKPLVARIESIEAVVRYDRFEIRGARIDELSHASEDSWMW